MKKVFLFYIAVLLVFVGCDADSIENLGNILSKTDIAVYGTSATAEEKVNTVVDSIETLKDTYTSGDAGELVSSIKQIKSNTLRTQLREALGGDIVVASEVYKPMQAVVYATNSLFNVASGVGHALDDLVDVLNGTGTQTLYQVQECIKNQINNSTENIKKAIPDEETQDKIQKMCDSFIEDVDLCGTAEQYKDTIVKIAGMVSPFMDFIDEVNNAGNEIVTTVHKPFGEGTEIVSGTGFVNGILVNELIQCVVDCGLEMKDKSGSVTTVISGALKVIDILDSIEAVNSNVQFESLEFLTSKILDFIEERNK